MSYPYRCVYPAVVVSPGGTLVAAKAEMKYTLVSDHIHETVKVGRPLPEERVGYARLMIAVFLIRWSDNELLDLFPGSGSGSEGYE